MRALVRWLSPRRRVQGRTQRERLAIAEISAQHWLSEQVYRRRTAKGLSYYGLARRIGQREQWIAEIEAGHGNPTLNDIARLAIALDCEPGVLLSKDEAA